MLGKWLRFLLWKPFEMSCRHFPLIPLKTTLQPLTESVCLIRTDNWVTKAISVLGGNYDYSVCYLVDNTLLIDTGYPWARRSLKKKLMAAGLHTQITTVVNTHSHEDHVGNNDLLAEITQARQYAHPLAISAIRYPAENPWYRNFMFGPQASSQVNPVSEWIHIKDYTFQVLPMPGHSPDHICLFEVNRRWLFSGDLYISADLDTQLREVDGNAWIRSLEKALALQPRWLFDAHGVVVSGEDQVQILLSNKLAFLVSLRKRIFEMANLAKSLNEITQLVFDKKHFVNKLSFSEGWLSLLTCSDFSRGHLVSSFLKEKEMPLFSDGPSITPKPA
jgi:glyoxylase-like metal-dependent hydrolase (beta-lactamase superfamily II)